MPQDRYKHQKGNGKTKWGFALIVTTAIIIAAVIIWQQKDRPVAPPSPTDHETTIPHEEVNDTPVSEEEDLESTPPEKMDEKTKKEMERVMEKQRQAALAAIDAKPIEGIVTERPEFVSEIEWEVFQNVITQQLENQDSENQDPESEIDLTKLVSKLLFYKKLEAWESMLADASSDKDKRRKLAKELMDMIPGQLDDKSIDLKSAKKMEGELLSDLESGK